MPPERVAPARAIGKKRVANNWISCAILLYFSQIRVDSSQVKGILFKKRRFLLLTRKHLLLAFEGGMDLLDRKNLFKTMGAGYLGLEELGHTPGGSLH